jgi:N-acetylglucosaminyldiphosphoundecaprenol N-acetyl-beta-D-mannosaminyltransferase
MNRSKIISLQISNLSYQQVLQAIMRLGAQRTPAYVCFANAHMSVEAYQNPHFARQVNKATVVAADGMPIVKAIQWFYKIRQERVAGMDMMASIVAECERNNLSIFLFGSTSEVLRAVERRISLEHPRLRVAGMYSPPFGPFTPADDELFVRQIVNSGAQVVLISLGCPRQEMWMARHYDRVNAVLIGIGGVFAVYGGLRRRAPLWMQEMSLEWLYRFVQEPTRMFRRYTITNTIFVLLLIHQWFRLKFSNKPI